MPPAIQDAAHLKPPGNDEGNSVRKEGHCRMPIVQFNAVDEFLAELTTDRTQVDRKLVRVTNLYQQSTQVPSLQYVSVVATARVATDIVRLDVYCGEVWNVDTQHSGPVLKKAEALQQRIREACAQLGFEVRAGVLKNAEAE